MIPQKFQLWDMEKCKMGHVYEYEKNCYTQVIKNIDIDIINIFNFGVKLVKDIIDARDL